MSVAKERPMSNVFVLFVVIFVEFEFLGVIFPIVLFNKNHFPGLSVK